MAANSLVGFQNTKFSVVRYGNVINSRGSVIPFFKKLLKENSNFLPVTEENMTRFFLTLDDSVKFVINCFSIMNKGELFIPKMFSLKIKDLAKTLKPGIKIKLVGIRPGEKIDELLCSKEENNNTLEFKKHFIIFRDDKSLQKYNRSIKNKKNKGKKVSKDFFYSSLNNSQLLQQKEILKRFPNII